MTKIKVPYYKGKMEIDIPKENLIGILESKADEYKVNKTQSEIVEEALNNPIESKRLEEIVKGKKTLTLITSDHTRPVPSKVTLPILLRRIREANKDIDITILIATGFHRETTREEMIDKFGIEIVESEKIVNHISTDDSMMVNLGKLPSGGDLIINKIAVETDVLISEGFIESHFFAGFSGGRKSVLPGVASAKTIMANHCGEFIASPNARTGILMNNPIHKDMLYAAKHSKLAFILNVVIDSEKKVIHAVAGDSEKAHLKGCEFVMELAKVKKTPSDIVVVTNGGYPLDQNMYQAVKGMTAAEANAKEDGVIIMIASCADGHGGQSFFDSIVNSKSPKELLDKIAKVERNETVPDQWEFQILARILDKFTVIVVTDMWEAKYIEKMHMKHAKTFDEALEKAFEIRGKEASITLIPDGVSVIVR